GTATTSYNSQNSSGPGHVLATLDNGTSTAAITVNRAPVITSVNSATFITGTAGSFNVTSSGYPAASYIATGTLPAGVTLSAGGLLSGTPAAGTGGTYPITITANNGVAPNSTQSFTLTVNQAPAITSANATTFTVGGAGSFTVTATGFPAPTVTETGTLPSGVTYDAATKTLGGTPAAGTGGTYAISFKAANGIGTDAVQSFTFTVNQAPAITSGNASSFAVGSAGTFTVTTTGFPVPTVTESGTLPSGVTFDGVTKKLAGTPAASTGGTYPISFKAANGVGTDATQTFTLTVNQAPAITSANSATFTVGAAGTFTVTATGFPTPTLGETGALPAGIAFAANTGVLSGTPGPDTQGTYNITLSASNGVGTAASQPFTLTVNAIPCTGAASGIISWLPGNGNPNDLLGSNNAVMQGGATFAAAKVGQGFNFVNAANATTGQYANVVTPIGLPVTNAARTVELWFRTGTTLTSSPNAALIQYGTAAIEKSFGLVFTATNPGKLYFNGGGDDLAGTTTVLPNQWYHAAVTYDGATVTLYLNGQIESSKATAVLNTVLDGANGLTIGSRPTVSVWNGQIDEVQIFNRALSQAEVQATYYAGAQGTCAPPLSLTSAISRRVHGSTAFDVALPLTGASGVEPRISTPAGSHTVVFTFTHSVTGGNATVTTGTGSAGAATFSGATMSVPLTNVTNAQQITLTLSAVTDALSQVLPATTVNMAVLASDVNADGVVNAADATITRNRSGLPVDATTFRADVNTDGAINAADATTVRNSSGTGLPIGPTTGHAEVSVSPSINVPEATSTRDDAGTDKP
ncbi:MAG: putative Ig domain-containing protein, partial [Verrucomicrobiota bacterium]|nr:putative Ig domain-containing protein [Verrucomicrobiota bacterium]